MFGRSQANQRLFREMGFASHVPRLLASAVPPPTAAPDGASGAAAGGGSGGGAAGDALAAAASKASGALSAAAGVVSGLALQAAGGVHVSRQKACIILCALESLMLMVRGAAWRADGVCGERTCVC